MSTTKPATHRATYAVTNYPGSSFTQRISWSCSCGKSGMLTDGHTAPTMARAKRAARKHIANEAAAL